MVKAIFIKAQNKALKVADDKRYNQSSAKKQLIWNGHRQWVEDTKFKSPTQETQQSRERERRADLLTVRPDNETDSSGPGTDGMGRKDKKGISDCGLRNAAKPAGPSAGQQGQEGHPCVEVERSMQRIFIFKVLTFKTRVPSLTTPIQHSFGSVGHSNQGRKRSKRNPDRKRRSETLAVCR